MGLWLPQREPTDLLVRRFVALAWEGILTGSLEGVREVVCPLVLAWFDSGVYRVAVLRLFGWKCCFLRAVAAYRGFVVPGKCTCLRVLRQGPLTEQARSRPFLRPLL
jgi:hypothetical protein